MAIFINQTVNNHTDQSSTSTRVNMEDYFDPGFKSKPAVHIGSQSMRLYKGDPSEQAVETIHIAAASEGDVVVARNIDPDYIQYWKQLMGNVEIISVNTSDMRTYLSNIVLNDKDLVNQIQTLTDGKSSMMVYFPTDIEKKLSNVIGVPLHGNPEISAKYGTKTGIRELSEEYKIPMPEGYVCRDIESVRLAIDSLFESYSQLIIKHTLSSAGRWMKKIRKSEKIDLVKLINELCGGTYSEGRDEFVVEAWVNSKASLCAQIEILDGKDPVIAAGWQQAIADDGVTYIGAVPLSLSSKAMSSFMQRVNLLANALKEKGAIGSYGPDFLVADSQSGYEEDNVLLMELNARVPVTAFSLETIKQVKGNIGSGFMTRSIKLPKRVSFREVRDLLEQNKLLVTQKGSNQGVIVYNPGLLDWKSLYYVAISDTWTGAFEISEKVNNLFTQS